MSVKAIIWDFEGVLTIPKTKHPHELIAEVLDVPAEPVKRFFNGDFNDQLDLGQISIQEFYVELGRVLGISTTNDNQFDRIFENALQINQELLDYAKQLHQRLRSALLSNYSKRLRELLQTKWKIGDVFDEVFISAEVKLIKPDPRIFQLALQRLGTQAEETIFVDDRQINILGAEKLGIHSIHFKDNQQVVREIQRLLED